mmetsp:Transcript_8974/g.31838  ORF Transcript_8974/g.31838 Transcript_8974/m.31838 type:complete len:144 (-) Transcript_8974:384-815(-)
MQTQARGKRRASSHTWEAQPWRKRDDRVLASVSDEDAAARSHRMFQDGEVEFCCCVDARSKEWKASCAAPASEHHRWNAVVSRSAPRGNPIGGWRRILEHNRRSAKRGRRNNLRQKVKRGFGCWFLGRPGRRPREGCQPSTCS